MPEKPSRSKLADRFFRDALARQVPPPGRLVEQAHDVDHRIIINRDDQIGILDIVDPGHVLVANTFDAVRAKAIVQQGGALQRFTGNNLAARENLLEVITAGNGPGRTGGQRHAAVGIIGPKHLLQHFFHGMPGDFIMPQVVAKLFKLVEDHQILAGLAQFPAFIEDLFDIRFAAGVAITSPAILASHSKRSLLMPSGRMAIDWQPNRAESYAPPRQ